MTATGSRTDRAFTLVALAFYAVLSLVKMRAYAMDGRFWAEEGSMFVAQFAALPVVDRIFYLCYGHLQLPTNLVVTLATLVPLKVAPLVTTYGGFLLQSIPVALIIAFRDRWQLSRAALLLLLVVIVGLPQAAEVWASSVLLPFHCSLLAALIAVMDTRSPYPVWPFRIVLAVCGLSGIPANFVAPVLLAQALTTRDRERWVQFGILAATVTIQVVLLGTHSGDTGMRAVALDPRLYWLPIVSQDILSPVFGVAVGDDLAAILRKVLANQSGAIGFAVLCSLGMVYLVKESLAERARRLWVIPLAALALVVLSIVGAIGDKVALVSAGGGARYFFASNVLLALLVASLAAVPGRAWARGLLVILAVSSLWRVPEFIGGPAWSVEYERAMSGRQPQINIWPPGWMMKNTALP